MMKINAAHILVGTLAEATAIKEKINEGSDFSLLASEYSTCPSGKNGGNLGFFGRGQMVKEFETVAFDTDVNTVSDPVRTQFGYHLIKRLY